MTATRALCYARFAAEAALFDHGAPATDVLSQMRRSLPGALRGEQVAAAASLLRLAPGEPLPAGMVGDAELRAIGQVVQSDIAVGEMPAPLAERLAEALARATSSCSDQLLLRSIELLHVAQPLWGGAGALPPHVVRALERATERATRQGADAEWAASQLPSPIAALGAAVEGRGADAITAAMATIEAKLREHNYTFMVGGIVRALHALYGAQVVLDELEVEALAASLAGRSSVEAAELIRLFQEQTGAVWKEDTPGLAYYRFGGDLRTIEADAGLLGQPLRKLLAVALPVSTELFPALVHDMEADYLNDLITEWQPLRDAHTGLDEHIRAGVANAQKGAAAHTMPPWPAEMDVAHRARLHGLVAAARMFRPLLAKARVLKVLTARHVAGGDGGGGGGGGGGGAGAQATRPSPDGAGESSAPSAALAAEATAGCAASSSGPPGQPVVTMEPLLHCSEETEFYLRNELAAGRELKPPIDATLQYRRSCDQPEYGYLFVLSYYRGAGLNEMFSYHNVLHRADFNPDTQSTRKMSTLAAVVASRSLSLPAGPSNARNITILDVVHAESTARFCTAVDLHPDNFKADGDAVMARLLTNDILRRKTTSSTPTPTATSLARIQASGGPESARVDSLSWDAASRLMAKVRDGYNAASRVLAEMGALSFGLSPRRLASACFV